jgi:glutamate formiminotransferase
VPFIECVPNLSEGRRPAVIQQFADAVASAGAALLDVTADPAHNRSVLTFAGHPPIVHAAVVALFERALAAVDLRRHRGEHPRVGAVDVVPFVPLHAAPMAVCVEAARSAGRTVGDRFGIPVYLYEDASPDDRRRRLEDIRRGGLSGLASRMTDPAWRPDFGPDRPHPSAGVSVIGARMPLIAYNVDLATDRLDVAKAVARSVRQSSGGLAGVKAIGLPLADRGRVQVSMNLTDFRVTTMPQAFDAVRRHAEALGVAVIDSELVGLAPQAALTPAIAAHVHLRDFDERRMVLERRLEAVLGADGVSGA